jgi:hypothetical protein
MYCPRKKFLAACWHLPSVLMESEVWVRPAQVGALFLHNLRVCLTFWHVMYPQNNIALFLHSLRLCWLFWHAIYLQNNVALFWHSLRLCWLFWRVSGSMSERVGCRVMAIHCYRPLLGPWDHKKVLCSNRGVVCRWNPGNELDLGVPMACQVGCDVFCLQYIHICYFFIYRSKWKQVYQSSMEKVVPMCCACQLA